MRLLLVLALIVAACTVVSAQQTVVIPAVTDNTPGVNDSIWVTEVQIIKKDNRDSLTIRRLWVCTPEGSFLEDSEAALAWSINGSKRISSKDAPRYGEVTSDESLVSTSGSGSQSAPCTASQS